jgi:hypothetical protein
MGDMRNAYIITTGEFEDLTVNGREDNIKNDHEYNRMVLTGFVDLG